MALDAALTEVESRSRHQILLGLTPLDEEVQKKEMSKEDWQKCGVPISAHETVIEHGEDQSEGGGRDRLH